MPSFTWLDLLWLAVPLYVVIQAVAVWRATGTARLIAGAPLIVMVPVFALTIAGLVRNSNLWPLLLLFSSPLALLYVAIAAIAGPSRRTGPAPPGPPRPETPRGRL